jgi:trehalose synthase
VVLQVSRWDRLKDPIGFLRMFAEHLRDVQGLHAIHAGPATAAVDDDPEGGEVFRACEEVWRSFEPDVRERLHLLSIPMDDLDENARIVNALQRRADVVVQKSLKEGFGLTVAEAMWKQRAVVGSRTGGIQDQIQDGVSGRLVDDPFDLASFAESVRDLIADPDRARQLGEAGQARVRERYLAPRILGQYAELVGELCS